jgi:hypothetical protein
MVSERFLNRILFLTSFNLSRLQDSEKQGFQVKFEQLEHKMQSERFDRDFEKAWNGEKLAEPDRTQRLSALVRVYAEEKARVAIDAEETD